MSQLSSFSIFCSRWFDVCGMLYIMRRALSVAYSQDDWNSFRLLREKPLFHTFSVWLQEEQHQFVSPLVSQSNTSAGCASNVPASSWCFAVIFRQQRCFYRHESTDCPNKVCSTPFTPTGQTQRIYSSMSGNLPPLWCSDSMNTTLRCHNGVTDSEQGGGKPRGLWLATRLWFVRSVF